MLRARVVQLFVFAALAAVLAVAGPAAADDRGSLAGDWKMVSSTPEGNEIPWTLKIRFKDGSYSASMISDQGDEQPQDFKVDGDNVSMRVAYQGGDYEIKLKRSGEKLVGTWSGNGDSGDTKGERAAGAAQ